MTDSIQVFPAGYQVTDASGTIMPGAVLSFYDAGTLNARGVFSDFLLTIPLGVTVTTDAAGRPAASGGTAAEVQIYTGHTAYKITAVDNTNTIIWSFDNLVGALDTSVFLTGAVGSSTPIFSETSTYQVLVTDAGKEINANPTGGSFTVTLPSAVTVGNGFEVTVKHVGTANAVTIATVGGQTIDGQSTQTLSFANEALTFVSDGANFFIKSDALALIPSLPAGYLTLTSGTPIIASDVTAVTSVFYTPLTGNIIPIYDGTRFGANIFQELTLTLSALHLANQIYDVFAFNNAGVVTIATGPAWSTPTAGSGARGAGGGTTEITRINGLYVNANSMTARNGGSTYSVAAQRGTYLGSLLIDATNGQITNHISYGQSRKWGVWNAFNRQKVVLLMGDPAASWAVAGNAPIRESNASTLNTAAFFTGLAEEWAGVIFNQFVDTASQGGQFAVGIGVNSTTAFTGYAGGETSASSTAKMTCTATAELSPSLGLNNVNALEKGSSAGTHTFFGTQINMQLVLEYRG